MAKPRIKRRVKPSEEFTAQVTGLLREVTSLLRLQIEVASLLREAAMATADTAETLRQVAALIAEHDRER